jgi:hypothetical protein
LARRAFLVRELSLDSAGPVDSAADLNITWAPKALEEQKAQAARRAPEVLPEATPADLREAAEWKAPAPGTASTASASAADSGKRA